MSIKEEKCTTPEQKRSTEEREGEQAGRQRERDGRGFYTCTPAIQSTVNSKRCPHSEVTEISVSRHISKCIHRKAASTTFGHSSLKWRL